MNELSRAWFWTGAFAAAVILVAVLMSTLAGINGRYPAISDGLCIGLVVGGVGLQATVFTLSRGFILLRLASLIATATLVYCFLWKFFDRRDFGDFERHLAAQWMLVAILCLVLRLCGFQLLKVPGWPPSTRSAGTQFSLIRLLMFTTLCAVVLGIGLQLRLPWQHDGLFTVFVATGFTCATFFPFIACLVARHALFYGALATVASAGIAATFAESGRGVSMFGLGLMATLFVWPAIVVAAAGLCLRRWQWRLVRPQALAALGGDAEASPTQAAQL